MSLDLYASKVQAEVLARRDGSKMDYRGHPDSNLYFCMVDLVQSSNYRISAGPESGFIRGESFFTLVAAASRPYTDIVVFKEIGDAVLMSCPQIRPLLEAGILMDRAARQLAFVAGNDEFPFSIRLGIDFGVAKRLRRRGDDYLGECIDRLARIMTVRSETSNFVLSEQAFDPNRGIIEEYRALYEITEPFQLAVTPGKRLKGQVIYRFLVPTAGSPADYNEYFIPWHNEYQGSRNPP